MMIADPIDAVNEDEVGAPPCGAEGAWRWSLARAGRSWPEN